MLRLKFMNATSAVTNGKHGKKTRLERNSKPCDTGAAFRQLSNQTEWELPWVSEVSFCLDFESFRGVLSLPLQIQTTKILSRTQGN